EQLRDEGGGPGGAVGRHRQVVERTGDLRHHRVGALVRVCLPVTHPATGPVPFEPVPDVVLLLEMAGQREVEERLAGGDQLHGGGQPALHDRHVGGRQVAVQIGHVAAYLKPV